MIKFLFDANGLYSTTRGILQGNYLGLLLRVSGSGSSTVNRPTGNVIVNMKTKGAIVTVPFTDLVDISNILYATVKDKSGTDFEFSAMVPFTLPYLANALHLAANEAEITLPAVDGATQATWEVYGITSDAPERFLPRIFTRSYNLSGNLNEMIDMENILAMYLRLGSGASAPDRILVKDDNELLVEADWDVLEAFTNMFSQIESEITDKIYLDLNPTKILSDALRDGLTVGAVGGSGSLYVTVISADFDNARTETSLVRIQTKIQNKIYRKFTSKRKPVPVSILGEAEQMKIKQVVV